MSKQDQQFVNTKIHIWMNQFLQNEFKQPTKQNEKKNGEIFTHHHGILV